MFRELTRKKKQISMEECIEVLKNETRGVLSVLGDDDGYKSEGEWAFNVKSVIVFGRVKLVEDIDRVVEISRNLCHKFTQDETFIKEEIENYAHQTLLLELTPEHICGKLVKES